MNSFQSIAISRNTSLAIVAPGIAEALFATALGLLAAIPAVIAYNRFNTESKIFSKIRKFFKKIYFNHLIKNGFKIKSFRKRTNE